MCRAAFFLIIITMTAIVNLNLVYAQQSIYQVTTEPGGVTDFVWSPDGDQFAFTTLVNDTSRLFVIHTDGTSKTLLTHTEAYGPMDWKGSVITFRSRQGTGTYDGLVKRIAPDGSDESSILQPFWYGTALIRDDAGWILFEEAPNGIWRAVRSDLTGNNQLVISHSSLVQQIGRFGNDYVLYGRGTNYNTTCGIHRVDFNGTGHVQLTPETLPNNALFIASPDLRKILYCDGAAGSWDIWIMDADGSNKTQLTTDAAHDYLSNTRDNIWSADGKSFYFISDRTGNGDIYNFRISDHILSRITTHDSLDQVPILSPDGTRLAFLSDRDGVSNIWILEFPHVVTIYPLQNQLNVPLNESISVTFDQDMDESSITSSSFLVYGQASGRHNGSITYNNASREVIWTSGREFFIGEKVDVTLTSEIRSIDGNALSKAFAWSFITLTRNGTGQFTLDGSYPAGEYPSAIIATDLDLDGFIDIATANDMSGDMTVLLNNGTGHFKSATRYPACSNPANIISADLVGDDHTPELVCSGWDTVLSIFVNQGDGTFLPEEPLMCEGPVYGLCAADFDGDGVQDIAAVRYYAAELIVFLGDGAGHFTNVFAVGTGRRAGCICAGDLDNDGDLDLVVGNEWDINISLYLNTGNGSFQHLTDYEVGGAPKSVQMVDMNADHLADIITSNIDIEGVPSSVSVMLNNGDVSFTLDNSYPVPGEAYSATVADLDGDFDMDIAAISNWESYFVLFFNDGNGTLGTPVQYPVSYNPIDIAAADFDHDGDMDLAVLPNPNTQMKMDQLNGAYTDYDYDDILIWHNRAEPPRVTEVTPSQNETAVNPGSSVSFTFDKDIKETTINESTVNVRGNLSGLYRGSLSFNAQTRDAVFYPDRQFLQGEKITVTLTTGIQSTQNESLPGGYSWAFHVRAEMGSGSVVKFHRDSFFTLDDPHSVFAADLDGDGDPDLAVANYASSTVSVLLNNGDNTYTTQPEIPVSDYPRSIYAADLDSDGDLDLATANTWSDQLTVLFNNGDATFSLENVYDVGNSPNTIVASDLDGDGDPELITTNYDSHNLSVLLNDGDGIFDEYKTVSLDSLAPQYIEVADLNDDGLQDLAVVAPASDNVVLFFNDGQAGFTRDTVLATGNSPQALCMADIDQDGDCDLMAVTFLDHSLSVFRNMGEGVFQQTGNYYIKPDAYPVSVVSADLDGDGDMDISTANSASGDLAVLWNNGSGIFTTPDHYPTGINPRSLFAADMDGNGQVDLITANGESDDVGIHLNRTFSPPELISTLPRRNAVHICDSVTIDVTFDSPMQERTINDSTFVVRGTLSGLHNGYITYDKTGYSSGFSSTRHFLPGEMVSVLLRNSIHSDEELALTQNWLFSFQVKTAPGNTLFTTQSAKAAASTTNAVATADLDADGDLDLITANTDSNSLSVYLNNGFATFYLDSVYQAGKSPSALVTGDLNGDGFMDIACSNSGSSDISFFINKGNAFFKMPLTLATGGQPMDIISADFDMDGDLDLVTCNYESSNIRVLNNDGSGNFPSYLSWPTGGHPQAICPADYNDDGFLDIAVANTDPGTLRILINNGYGLFSSSTVFTLPAEPVALTSGDFNADYVPDLAILGSSRLTVFKNDSLGTFSDDEAYPIGDEARDITTADIDGDGDLDLLFANPGEQSVTILYNDGSGSYGTDVNYSAGEKPYALYAADFNGDDALDLAVGDRQSRFITIMLNDTSMTAIAAEEHKPLRVQLHQNFPNPFNAVTVFSYGLLAASEIEIDIFNILGQKVYAIKPGKQQPGYHTNQWNAEGYSSGVYYYRLTAKNGHQNTRSLIRKMILIK